MIHWNELLSRFLSLEAERRTARTDALELEATRAAFEAWAAGAVVAVMADLEGILHDRVGRLRRASGCGLELVALGHSAASDYGYCATSLRLLLPPCHVDVYVAQNVGHQPRIHLTAASGRRRHATVVSVFGAAVVPAGSGGYELTDQAGLRVAPAALCERGLELLVDTARAHARLRTRPGNDQRTLAAFSLPALASPTLVRG